MGSLSLSFSTASALVFSGQPSATVNVTLNRQGTTGDVTLSVQGLPTGAAATIQSPGTSNSGSITLSASSAAAATYPLTVTASDGTVSYTLPNQTAAQTAGQIQLANFANPAGLNSLGNNLYAPTDASGDPTVGAPGGAEGLGSLLQGYTEQSNVSIVNEFINLIQAQRGYESNSKVVQAADQMYQQVNGLIR